MSADELNIRLNAWLAEAGPSLVGLRRYLHANPELSGAEFGTARHVADLLKDADLAPVLLPKGNGVLCDVGPAEPESRLVAVRADLDALPLQDLKDVPYRSRRDGLCHACGHDVHTTVVAGLGLFLASLGAALPGRVRLVFQPAEEILPCGSLEVIEAGGIDGVEEIFALHCDPKLPVGQVGLREGPLTAAADNVAIHLKGPGGHTARPHLSSDLVDALGRVVTEVPAILARRVDARSGVLLVFGQVSAGTVSNVIPTDGFAAGTVRMLDRNAWGVAPGLITEIVNGVIAATGVTAHIDYQRGRPPVENSRRSIQSFTSGVLEALGHEAIATTTQSMGGEDFSWYLEQIPGAMARLGVGRPNEDLDLHQGSFDVDERAIAAGVRVLAHTVMNSLLR